VSDHFDPALGLETEVDLEEVVIQEYPEVADASYIQDDHHNIHHNHLPVHLVDPVLDRQNQVNGDVGVVDVNRSLPIVVIDDEDVGVDVDDVGDRRNDLMGFRKVIVASSWLVYVVLGQVMFHGAYLGSGEREGYVQACHSVVASCLSQMVISSLVLTRASRDLDCWLRPSGDGSLLLEHSKRLGQTLPWRQRRQQ
jgi:hypothetical protein